MNIETIEAPDRSLNDFFDKRIEEFNVARWEIKEIKPIAVKVTNDEGDIVAGAGGRSFGMWLLLDNLWVSEPLRGKGLGSKILAKVELAAMDRGCQFLLLATLNFQARPFYEKQGYKVQWVQNNYPKDGCKYHMVKELTPHVTGKTPHFNR